MHTCRILLLLLSSLLTLPISAAENRSRDRIDSDTRIAPDPRGTKDRDDANEEPEASERLDSNADADAAHAQVRDFLLRFIDPNKTPAQQAALFTDQADYYNRGAIGKSAIMKDIDRTARRWPWRYFRLLEIDDIRSDRSAPDNEADRVVVTYRVSFEVASPSNTIAGIAAYEAVIVDLNDDPRVDAISEKILKRDRYSTLD